MNISEHTKNELFYKLAAVKQFLIFNNGYEHKLFNHLCPLDNIEPDSNIVEYLDDIESIVSSLISSEEEIETDNEYF